MSRLDERTSYYFNALLADVDIVDGLSPTQRDIAIQFAQSWILDAMNNDADVELAYRVVREGLLRIVRERRETFVLRAGAQTMVVEKLQG